MIRRSHYTERADRSALVEEVLRGPLRDEYRAVRPSEASGLLEYADHAERHPVYLYLLVEYVEIVERSVGDIEAKHGRVLVVCVEVAPIQYLHPYRILERLGFAPDRAQRDVLV